jgi:hypothetical protein
MGIDDPRGSGDAWQQKNHTIKRTQGLASLGFLFMARETTFSFTQTKEKAVIQLPAMQKLNQFNNQIPKLKR